MLTAIIPPTTRNLMAPETVLARLGLPESALPEVTFQVEEASGLVARYLGYECAFGTWQEGFLGASGRLLDLGARPAWAILSVARNGTSYDSDSYQLRRGPYGESAIYRASGWAPALWGGYPEDLTVSSTYSVPDYVVQFEAGWWLEEMTGTQPAGVGSLPPELRADFLKVVRYLRATTSYNPGVRRMREEGAEVEFFAPGDQAVDPMTGIPLSCCSALTLYRRAQ